MENNYPWSSSCDSSVLQGEANVIPAVRPRDVKEGHDGELPAAKKAKTAVSTSHEDEVKHGLTDPRSTGPNGRIIPIVSLSVGFLYRVDHANRMDGVLAFGGQTLTLVGASRVYGNELRNCSYEQFLEMVLDRLEALGLQGFNREEPCPITFYRLIAGNRYIPLTVGGNLVNSQWLAMDRFWEMAREEMDLIGYHLPAAPADD